MAKLKISAAAAAAPGDVTLLLHAHAPFVRQPGRDASGEEGLHGLIADSYAPLLAGVYDLTEAGTRVRLGLAISPILLEQLADPVVQKHTVQTLETALARAEDRVQYHKSQHDGHAAYLAEFYAQLHRRTLHVFERQFGRNLVAATRILAEAGVIEILADTATHVVPQCVDRNTLRVQLEAGLISIMRHLKQHPTVLWAADEPISRALVELLPPLGLRGVVGTVDGQAASQIHWLNAEKSVWALTPDARLLTHLQSTTGYSGDTLYRAAAAAAFSDGTLASNGAPYDPYHAYARTRLHTAHFAAVLAEWRDAQPTPLVLACSLELFGSGWFEGGLWLRTVIEHIHQSPTLRLRRPSVVVAQHPPTTQIAVPRSDDVVDGELLSAAMRLRETVQDYPRAYGDREEVLNQAARELLLAQSGDWDRVPANDNAYAAERRRTHLARLARLIELAEHEVLLPVAAQEYAELKERDNPFPALNYRLFGSYEDR